MKVLVVDDSPTVLSFTSRALASVGHEVETADNIWISTQVTNFRPDLILLDVNLGPCLGTQAVRALKDRKIAKSCRLVLYSTLEASELEKLARECGAHGYIPKCGDPEVLRQMVSGYQPSHSGALPIH